MPVTLPYDPSKTALFHPERRETIFERGSTYSIPQLAVEAARLAYYRVEESVDERARLAEALGRVGFADLELFCDPARGAAAFAAIGSDGTTLLSFRGTQPDNIEALFTDLRLNWVDWRKSDGDSAGKVHGGFALAIQALEPKIVAWIARARPDLSKLILTGHSLGAAMATLAATIWRPQWLVTFGSPRVGDSNFVGAVQATHSARYVDCCDAVTEEPHEFLGYRHLRNPTYLTRDGLIVDNPDASFIYADRFRARIDYVRQYSWEVLQDVPLRDLADHAPMNYARGVFAAT